MDVLRPGCPSHLRERARLGGADLPGPVGSHLPQPQPLPGPRQSPLGGRLRSHVGPGRGTRAIRPPGTPLLPGQGARVQPPVSVRLLAGMPPHPTPTPPHPRPARQCLTITCAQWVGPLMKCFKSLHSDAPLSPAAQDLTMQSPGAAPQEQGALGLSPHPSL